MRLVGNANPEFGKAARTRARAPCAAASGRPTMRKLGSLPWEMSTSTSTSAPSSPIRAPAIGSQFLHRLLAGPVEASQHVYQPILDAEAPVRGHLSMPARVWTILAAYASMDIDCDRFVRDQA